MGRQSLRAFLCAVCALQDVLASRKITSSSQLDFPIIADETREIANLLGMMVAWPGFAATALRTMCPQALAGSFGDRRLQQAFHACPGTFPHRPGPRAVGSLGSDWSDSVLLSCLA